MPHGLEPASFRRTASERAAFASRWSTVRGFLQETARFRTRGFRMFIVCLICFAGNVYAAPTCYRAPPSPAAVAA